MREAKFARQAENRKRWKEKLEATETPEEKAARLKINLLRLKERHRNESAEQKAERLRRKREAHKKRFANMSEEEKIERRRKIAVAQRIHRLKMLNGIEKDVKITEIRICDKKIEKPPKNSSSQSSSKQTETVTSSTSSNVALNSTPDIIALDSNDTNSVLTVVEKNNPQDEIESINIESKLIPASVDVIKLHEIETVFVGKEIKEEPEIEICDVKISITPIDTLKCSFCSEVFEYKSELILHEIKHKKEEELDPKKFFQCKHCVFKSESIDEIIEHTKNHKKTQAISTPKAYKNLKQYFKCKYCIFMTDSKEEITRHTAQHKGEFKCISCNLVFNDDQSYKLHIEKDHVKDHLQTRCPYKCPTCQKGFKGKGDLNLHKRTHR